ncbi:MAG: cysteine rich repeat-containing protein [Hyphomicrobium sp.]
MRLVKTLATVLLASTVLTAGVSAQQGPVATACKDDISKHCAGKEHGQGEVRACLEANKDKVSAACKTALDTTGPGKGMGQPK